MNFEKNEQISYKHSKIKVQVCHSSLHDHICSVAKTQVVIQECRLLILLIWYIYKFSIEQNSFRLEKQAFGSYPTWLLYV